jgi:hypothetical protein
MQRAVQASVGQSNAVVGKAEAELQLKECFAGRPFVPQVHQSPPGEQSSGFAGI